MAAFRGAGLGLAIPGNILEYYPDLTIVLCLIVYRDSDFSDSYSGVYDFGARYNNPLYGRWFAHDPAKQGINPYVYCGNNPVMSVDPDGRRWFGDQRAMLMAQLRQMARVLRRMKFDDMLMLNEPNIGKEQKDALNDDIEDIRYRLKGLRKDRKNILALDKDDTIYEMRYSDSDIYATHLAEDGHVMIEYGSLGIGAHEREHNVQWLGKANFKERFSKDGFLFNAGRDYDTKTANEKSAYQLQYSYDGAGSFPGTISSYIRYKCRYDI